MTDVTPQTSSSGPPAAPPPVPPFGRIPQPRAPFEPPTPPPNRQPNGLATAGLIVAIIALLAAFSSGGGLAWLLTIAAGVLSIVGIVRARDGQPGRGPAAAGIVLSVLALLGCMAQAGRSVGTPGQTVSAPTYSAPSYSAPSYAAPSYAAPAPTTEAAPPIPLRTYTGTGDDVVKLDKPSGAAVMSFSCPKCQSNTIINSDGYDYGLVNEIGPYVGKRLIDARDGSTTSQLTIKAKGKWTLTVGGLDQIRRATGPVSGKGDDVVIVNGSTTTATLTNRGESNFIVKAITSDGSYDTPINEIGSYSGTVPLRMPALIEVKSSGSWTITPR